MATERKEVVTQTVACMLPGLYRILESRNKSRPAFFARKRCRRRFC